VVPADQEIYVTIAGLANNYASYVTTFEEYQAQRYEAASTIYGPHTLEGYIQEFTRIASDLAAGKETEVGPQPVNLYDVQLELMPKNKYDRAPEGSPFGAIINGTDVKPAYGVGDVVTATFQV
jgi:neutral ceramidase